MYFPCPTLFRRPFPKMASKANDEVSPSTINYMPDVGSPDGATSGAVTPPPEDRKSERTESLANRDDEKDIANIPGSKRSSFDELSGTNQVKYGPDGEPIIQNGSDVSRFLVSTRDDGDPPVTFRGIVLGTIFTALSSSM